MQAVRLWHVRWLLLALFGVVGLYLPTLRLPLDFVDDGAIAYFPPEADSSERWGGFWHKTISEFHGKGPFRPLTWLTWDWETNFFGDQALPRRALRLFVCLAAAGLWLLFLLRLGIPGVVACWTLAFAYWNPYRNEIWMAFGLTEAIAAPYAAGAFLAALLAARSPRPWPWDVLAFLLLLACLAVKITFLALVPALVVLRLLGAGNGWREGWRRGYPALLLLASAALLPVVQFLLYTQYTASSGYRVGVNPWQLSRVVQGVARAGSILFLVGPLVLLLVLAWRARASSPEPAFTEQDKTQSGQATWWTGAVLLLVGCVVYVPIQGFAGRYSIPAAWGWDLCLAALLAVLLSRVAVTARGWVHASLALALVVLAATNINQQQRVLARHETLWMALRHVENEAPPGATVVFLGAPFGQGKPGELVLDEGQHFIWHVRGRSRRDLTVRLVNSQHPEQLEAVVRESPSVCVVAGLLPPSLQDKFPRRDSFHVPAYTERQPLTCWVALPGAAREHHAAR